jgi:hypothetical protein
MLGVFSGCDLVRLNALAAALLSKSTVPALLTQIAVKRLGEISNDQQLESRTMSVGQL